MSDRTGHNFGNVKISFDVGCVVLNVTDVDGMQAAYDTIMANAAQNAPGARVQGVLAEQMLPKGFEVLLAIDEFSWSKKTQPYRLRRRIAAMAVADVFHVSIFPEDFPVNIANPENLHELRAAFPGRSVSIVVGSDVVANASSYRLPPSPGCVQEMNHIVFRRQSDADGQAIDADLSRIRGKVLELQLPTHLEDISSSRIRDNIDLGRDISNLIDPTVQDFIYRNGLYLREPQYKRILLAGDLEFRCIPRPDDALRVEAEEFAAAQGASLPLEETDPLLFLRRGGTVLGVLTTRDVGSAQLYGVLGDADTADAVRRRAAYDKAAGRVDIKLRIPIDEPRREGRADDTLDDGLTQVFDRDAVGMLGGNDDGIDALHAAVLAVLHRDLTLAVRAQPVELAGLANGRQLHGKLLGIGDGSRHQLGRFVAGEAEHHALIARAVVERAVAGLLALERLVDAEGNVRALLVDVRDDGAGLAVKAVFCAVVADLAHGLAHDLRDVDVAVGRDLAHDVHDAGRDRAFAGDAAVRVLRQNGVEDRVGDLVADLVGMSLRDGFGCKEMMSHWYSSLSVVPGKETSAPTADGALGKGEDPHLSICTAGFGTLQVSAGCRASQGRSLRHS